MRQKSEEAEEVERPDAEEKRREPPPCPGSRPAGHATDDPWSGHETQEIAPRRAEKVGRSRGR
jgi:hypothetical protein